MDHKLQRDGGGDFVVNVESLGARNEEVGDEKLGRSFCAEVDGSVDCENGVNVICGEANDFEGSADKLKVLTNKDVGVKGEDLVPNKTRNERRKSTSAKKPPKPPRPTKGYSLDAADQKLIKEIAELAMLKRSRIERMKALKKMKAAKASSASNSRGNILAMIFSVLFFLVIVFHGISCHSSSTSQFHGSPEATGSVESLIMLQHQKSFPSNGIHSTTSESPKLVEQISGSDPLNKLTKASS